MKRERKKQKGFTLVEMMAVLVIIALVAGIVAVSVIPRTEKARRDVVKAQMWEFEKSIKMFNLDTGAYPRDLNDLVTDPGDVSNWGPKPYIDRVPKDPWGSSYIYEYTGEGSPPYRIISPGPDRQQGTPDDLTNIELLHGGEEGSTGY